MGSDITFSVMLSSVFLSLQDIHNQKLSLNSNIRRLHKGYKRLVIFSFYKTFKDCLPIIFLPQENFQ